MYINIPEDVRFLCLKLEYYGYPAYVVGGCVRDALMERVPKDWDITTSATYDEIAECLKKYVKVIPMKNSREHNVCFVRYNHQQYEIATFRTDGEYEDHRHTKTKVVATIEEDLSRRDFTINAMAYRPLTDELLDIYGGYKDILDKKIRAVGDPEKRISEDALRILRAYRFSILLGFNLDDDLKRSLIAHWDDLKYVSMERKREEVNKILMWDGWKIFLKCPKDLETRWALMLSERDDAEDVLRTFKFDNVFIKNVKALVNRKEYKYNSRLEVKKLCAKLGPALVEKFFDIIDAETYVNEGKHSDEIKTARVWLKEIQNEPYRLKDLAINGDDLIDTFSGKELGAKLNYLLELVQEHPELNKKEILLTIAKLV